jgi:cell division protein FtsB
MKNIQDVIAEKTKQLTQLRMEIQVLNKAVELLREEGDKPQPEPTAAATAATPKGWP